MTTAYISEDQSALPAWLRFTLGLLSGTLVSVLALSMLSLVLPPPSMLPRINETLIVPSPAPELLGAGGNAVGEDANAAVSAQIGTVEKPKENAPFVAGLDRSRILSDSGLDTLGTAESLAGRPAPAPGVSLGPDAAPDPTLPLAVPSREVLPPTREAKAPVRAPSAEGLPDFRQPDGRAGLSGEQLAVLAPRSGDEAETSAWGRAPSGANPTVLDPPGFRSNSALEANAAVFDAPLGTPLVAVVLEDAGRGGLDISSLRALGIPLTIGVVAGREGDRDLALAVRSAGHEILAQLPMDGARLWATPVRLTLDMPHEDAASETKRLMAQLSVAVAASNHRGVNANRDPQFMAAVIGSLSQNGYGFLEDRPGASSSLSRIARDAQVPFAETSRFVPAGSSAAQAYDVIEVAAREAEAQGSAIVRGPASAAMLEAVLRWALERSSSSARIAPLSAVLRARTR